MCVCVCVSIYLYLYLSIYLGKSSVFLLGLLYSLCGIKSVAVFISNAIPFVIKVGVCLGVGLLIALEALIEIGLVRTGQHTVLDIGSFTLDIYIAMVAFVLIGLALHYKIRGSFLIGLGFGAIVFWICKWMGIETSDGSANSLWPTDNMIDSNQLSISFAHLLSSSSLADGRVTRLVFDLYIIGVILLNGLAHGLAETSGLKREDGSLPGGKGLYIACGVGTMLAAALGELYNA